MVSSNSLIWDMKHLEEKSQILDEVGIIIIMNVEPIHGMGCWILISDTPTPHPTRDQNWTRETSSTLGWNKSQLIVSLHILLLHLIQILNSRKTELLEILLDLRGGVFGNMTGFGLTVGLSGNEVIGFHGSDDLAEAEGELGVVLVGGEGAGRDGGDGSASSSNYGGLSNYRRKHDELEGTSCSCFGDGYS